MQLCEEPVLCALRLDRIVTSCLRFLRVKPNTEFAKRVKRRIAHLPAHSLDYNRRQRLFFGLHSVEIAIRLNHM